MSAPRKRGRPPLAGGAGKTGAWALRMPVELSERLFAAAREEGEEAATLARMALREYLDRRDERKRSSAGITKP